MEKSTVINGMLAKLMLWQIAGEHGSGGVSIGVAGIEQDLQLVMGSETGALYFRPTLRNGQIVAKPVRW